MVLDEFTYPLAYGWLDPAETLAWLKQNKPASLHLVITGRNARPHCWSMPTWSVKAAKSNILFSKASKPSPESNSSQTAA